MEVSKETIWSSRELFRAYEFRMIFSGSQANRAMRKVVVISHLAHHEASMSCFCVTGTSLSTVRHMGYSRTCCGRLS